MSGFVLSPTTARPRVTAQLETARYKNEEYIVYKASNREPDPRVEILKGLAGCGVT